MGMTIEKAIELLDIAKEGWPVGDNEDYYKALELGIEALKAIRTYREPKTDVTFEPLPGETKE